MMLAITRYAAELPSPARRYLSDASSPAGPVGSPLWTTPSRRKLSVGSSMIEHMFETMDPYGDWDEFVPPVPPDDEDVEAALAVTPAMTTRICTTRLPGSAV